MTIEHHQDDARAIIATPTEDALPRRFADFDTLGEALDYAASGARGLNFHDARGTLTRPYPFAELREDALTCARRLIASGVKPEERIALVAETGPEFAALFFGVVYAGAWPVPLPLPTSFGGRDSYIEQLRVQLASCDPKMLIFPPELAQMAGAAAEAAGVEGVDWDSFATRAAPETKLPKADPEAIAYLQYSSGSTRFPHGVAITHHALLNNLAAHSHGMKIQERPLHLVAALVSRHGAGRLLPVADRQPSVDRLPQDRGFRAPSTRLAGHDQPQFRYFGQLFADLRL